MNKLHILYIDNPGHYKEPEKREKEIKRRNWVSKKLSEKNYDVAYGDSLKQQTSLRMIQLKEFDLLITHLYAWRFDDEINYRPSISAILRLCNTHFQKHNLSLPTIIYTGATYNEITDEELEKQAKPNYIKEENSPEIIRKTDNFKKDLHKIDLCLEKLLEEKYIPLFSKKMRLFRYFFSSYSIRQFVEKVKSYAIFERTK